MKRMIKSVLNALGYEVRRKPPSLKQFSVGDIKYECDPCSIGWEPQGEGTAEGAIRMIRERQLYDLKVLDVCCGVGVIGLTIFSRLCNEGVVKEIALSDINVFNINSLERTLRVNQLDKLVPDQIRYWLSDSLKHIPHGARFDVIVSNPPHFWAKRHSDQQLPPNRLAMYDADWSFHKSFYARCHEHLTNRGEVWFLENGDAAQSSDFLPYIEANSELKFIDHFPEPLLPGFFWMITRKAQPH